MILTDERGVPFERPRREEYASDVEFLRAFHVYRDRVSGCANSAFAEAFSNARSKR